MSLKCNCDIFVQKLESPYLKGSGCRSPKLSLRDKMSIAQKIGKSSQFTRKTSNRIRLNVLAQDETDDLTPRLKQIELEPQTLSSSTTQRKSEGRLKVFHRSDMIKIVSPARFASPQNHYQYQKPKGIAQMSYPLFNLIQPKQFALQPTPDVTISPLKPSLSMKNIQSLETTVNNVTRQPMTQANSAILKQHSSGHKRYYTIDLPAIDTHSESSCSDRTEAQAKHKPSIAEKSMMPESVISTSVVCKPRESFLNDHTHFEKLNMLHPKDTISTMDNFDKQSILSNGYSEVIYRKSGRVSDREVSSTSQII